MSIQNPSRSTMIGRTAATLAPSTTTLLRTLIAALAAATLATTASAALITQTNNDASGVTSFKDKANWNDSVAPNVNNDYLGAGFLMRSPGDNVSYTFQGHSLTLSNTGTAGSMLLKGLAAATYTFGTNAATGLFLDNGWIADG